MKKYNWSKWFSQTRFTLKKGQHFDCSIVAICQQIRNQATRESKLVTVTVQDDDKVVQVKVRDKFDA
jgi:hypothetical protein